MVLRCPVFPVNLVPGGGWLVPGGGWLVPGGGWRLAACLAACAALAACGGGTLAPAPMPSPALRPAPARPAPPPAADPAPPPPAAFRAPTIMAEEGVADLIRLDAAQLVRRLGAPRLDVPEGDMRKLQFAGRACVLDVFLYPLAPGAEPVATHVEARRASDGQTVDRGDCARSLGAGR